MKRFDNPMLMTQATQIVKEQNSLLSKGNLEDYSWQELKIIAEDLSKHFKKSVYHDHMREIMATGSTKRLETSSNIIGERASVRIIGLCQDQKSDGSGYAGLTFQFTSVLEARTRTNLTCEAICTWANSSVRMWLNGEVLNSLPGSVKNNIVSVRKYCYNEHSSSGTSVFESTEDSLFLLSGQELYGDMNDYPREYKLEGTGAGHKKQYSWYSLAKVTKKNYWQLASMRPSCDDNNNSWCLRTAGLEYHNCSTTDYNPFWSVNTSSGKLCLISTSRDYDVIPAFAF